MAVWAQTKEREIVQKRESMRLSKDLDYSLIPGQPSLPQPTTQLVCRSIPTAMLLLATCWPLLPAAAACCCGLPACLPAYLPACLPASHASLQGAVGGYEPSRSTQFGLRGGRGNKAGPYMNNINTSTARIITIAR